MKKFVTSLKGMKKSMLITLGLIFTFSLVLMIYGIMLAATGEWKAPPKNHTITLSGEGYNVMRLVGTGDKIKRGTDFHFQILLQNNFIGMPVVKVNNAVVTANVDDVYSIWNVKSNKTIDVSGLVHIPKLNTPNNLEINGTILSWADLAYASSYTVRIMWTGLDDANGTYIDMEVSHIVNGTSFDLSQLPNTKHIVMVKANAVENIYQESEWSNMIHFNCGCILDY